MKLDSKYFDSIRIAPKDEAPKAAAKLGCQWKGCRSPGSHRAPRGRGQEGYFLFCVDHVRQFNATYNYFDGMSSAEVESFQKNATTGHRPTWKLGENGIAGDAPPQPSGAERYARFRKPNRGDPHDLFGEETAREPQKRRGLKPLERKALDTMHLPETATKADIKSRFKELVKRHHPDANGGDRGSEEKLREIIQAYNYLKQAGLV
jgi:DnaJ domain